MSSVAVPEPVNAIPATNGDASEVPAVTTNNAGTADDATVASASAGQNLSSETHIAPEEAGYKVFAGNLAYATTDEGLKTFFSEFTNDIVSSEVIHRGSRPAGYGFVSFKTLEAAEQAVAQLNDKELDGRPVIVQLAKPNAEKEKERNEKRAKRRATGRRNARAPLGEVTEAEAEGQTDDAQPPKAENAVEGAVAAEGDAPKPRKKKNKNKRRYKARRTAIDGEQDQAADNLGEPSAGDAETAEAAPKARKPRAPRPPRAPRTADGQPEGQPSKSVLFVANLAFSIDDARLKQVFTDAGIDVVSARVVQRRWGARRSKGFGFVDVGNEEEQKKALAYFAPVEAQDGETPVGKEVDGRQIVVKVAIDTLKREHVEMDADAGAYSAQKSDTTPEAAVVAH